MDLYKRNFKHFNEESFKHDISIQKWNNNLNDVNSMYNDFIWRLEGCVNHHAPITKLNRKEKNKNQKPWITNEMLKKLTKETNYLLEKRTIQKMKP